MLVRLTNDWIEFDKQIFFDLLKNLKDKPQL